MYFHTNSDLMIQLHRNASTVYTWDQETGKASIVARFKQMIITADGQMGICSVEANVTDPVGLKAPSKYVIEHDLNRATFLRREYGSKKAGSDSKCENLQSGGTGLQAKAEEKGRQKVRGGLFAVVDRRGFFYRVTVIPTPGEVSFAI